MAIKVLNAVKKKLRKRSTSKVISSPFLHSEYSTLPQILVKEMKIAYEESNITPGICRDEIEVVCTGEVEPGRSPKLSVNFLETSATFDPSSDALPLAVSWVSFKFNNSHEASMAASSDTSTSIAEVVKKTTVCADIPEQFPDIIAPPMEVSVSSTATESRSAALPQCVSWMSFKLAESREISVAISIESLATVKGPLPVLEKFPKVLTHPCTSKKARATARNSYTQYLLEENKKMALSALSDTPYVSPPTPPRFTADPSLSKPLIALSTSTSFRNWVKAEGARVAKSKLAEGADDEMADVPLRFKQAHPILSACRKQVSAYIHALEDSSSRFGGKVPCKVPTISVAATDMCISERSKSPPAVRAVVNHVAEADSIVKRPVAGNAKITRQGSFKRLFAKATQLSRRQLNVRPGKENISPPTPPPPRGHRRPLSITPHRTFHMVL
ncbi:hypothetical protein HWV62_14558 [Athelia sp. TMB]|nr:hypothetical protein HWV62_14558 [Athelia sp. TMB]